MALEPASLLAVAILSAIHARVANAGALLVVPDVPRHVAAKAVLNGIDSMSQEIAKRLAPCTAMPYHHEQFRGDAAVRAKNTIAKYLTENQKTPPADLFATTMTAVDETLQKKLCSGGNLVTAPYTPDLPEGVPKHEECIPAKVDAVSLESAVAYQKTPGNEFDDNGKFKDLFPTCDCEREKFLGAGTGGVVYLVKLKDNTKAAMKIAACGTLNSEIYAQQKLQAKKVTWVNKMHKWGRSSGKQPKWDFYIMDLLEGSVMDTYNAGGMPDPKMVTEALKLTMQAAHEMHTTFNFAHSDLHFGNVALVKGKPKEFKIIDFGLIMPVTPENGIYAYLDYWRVAESVDVFGEKLFPGGPKPLYDILDKIAAQLLDGQPNPANAKANEFPKKEFFTAVVHKEFTDHFIAKSWVSQASFNKPLECTLDGGLYKTLAPLSAGIKLTVVTQAVRDKIPLSYKTVNA